MQASIKRLLLVLLLGPLTALAGVIVGPVSVTSNVPTRPNGYSLDALIDQSGLSAGYTSGVTDFGTYIASDPTHDSGLAINGWGTENGTTSATLLFDLGGLTLIDSLAVWNRGDSTQGIRDFDLFACSDAACTIESFLGDFTAASGTTNDLVVPAQTFSFAETNASYVRMDIDNGYNSTVLTLGEVAFEASAPSTSVPEPASLALVLLSLLGLATSRRFKHR